ncbi:LacI family DNA-binding transcriptional regulator [soil metagenome]
MTPSASPEPNIRQVASIAGVSHMTVSRVLNGHPNIKDATRSRVLEVIEQLNYRPNNAARSLSTRRTRRIGVMVESAVEFGPSSTVRAIEYAAREVGYSVLSLALRDGDEVSPDEAVSRLTEQGVDAICVIAPRSSSVMAMRKLTMSVPVLIVKAEKDPVFLTVTVDQAAGAKLVVDHLAELGHRDVLHLSGPLDWLEARGRERAFHARAREWGMRERPIVVGDWTADFGYDFARGIDGVPEYTAMFVSNDEMALGVMHGFHDNGIRIPDDISIVGFDDLPVARHFIPPLTTVRQDFHALGLKAVEVLRAAIEGAEIPQRTKIPVELVVRESSAPPRRAVR